MVLENKAGVSNEKNLRNPESGPSEVKHFRPREP